jgi:hypothetical protein
MWVAVERAKTSKYVGNISTNDISKEWVTRANQNFTICREEFIKPTLQNMWVIV